MRNAVAAGFPPDDLEEREISLADYLALAPRATRIPAIDLDGLATLLVEKKILTAQDVEGKKK